MGRNPYQMTFDTQNKAHLIAILLIWFTDLNLSRYINKSGVSFICCYKNSLGPSWKCTNIKFPPVWKSFGWRREKKNRNFSWLFWWQNKRDIEQYELFLVVHLTDAIFGSIWTANYIFSACFLYCNINNLWNMNNLLTPNIHMFSLGWCENRKHMRNMENKIWYHQSQYIIQEIYFKQGRLGTILHLCCYLLKGLN